MDEFMDALWGNILIMAQYGASLLDRLLTPFHVFGPLVVMTLLALVTVVVTKLLNRVIVTKRYTRLEKDFQHWFKIRQEAMKCEDYEKAKRLARNIDQAKLNRVYYDYFLEGFLLGLMRNVLPIFLMCTYINVYYRAEELSRLFGKAYMLSIPSTGGEPILVGAIFYYIMTLLLSYLAWFIVTKIAAKKVSSPKSLESVTADLA
ncbi:MAG: hypothetical protein U9R66_04995 [Thermodesulfobacteriota bacterium]|nr:hypothetical protein [Thermodesulfobacteriota bacterium]